MASLKIVVLLAACASSLSCGGYYFVGFVSNPGGTTSITGVVTIVSKGLIADPGGVTQYTAVTFTKAGAETTINFCGDQQHLFPIDATVKADYTVGALCAVIANVVVMDNDVQNRRMPRDSPESTRRRDFASLIRPRTFCQSCQS